MSDEFKVYNMGGSCCTRRMSTYQGQSILIKEICKNVEGIENGYKKFYYEIQHMKKYQYTRLFPQIVYEDCTDEIYSVGMEYCFDGATLSDLIRNPCVSMDYYYKSFEFVMDEMFKKVYLKEKGNSDINYLDKCYFERVLNRLNKIEYLNLLEKYGFSNFISRAIKEGCEINGIFYPPIEEYISLMRQDKELISRLNISYSTQCHYDLCPLNILVDVNLLNEKITDFKLIDVRGENETGKEIRHYMYDMGKMLLGLDAFDLFRLFNKKGESFWMEYENNIDIPQIKFAFIKASIYERYRAAYEYFWEYMQKKEYYSEKLNESQDNLRLKYMFAQSMMYHPDVPCRIIYEKNEELAILMYMRGLMYIKAFILEIYGKDPITNEYQNVDIWPVRM